LGDKRELDGRLCVDNEWVNARQATVTTWILLVDPILPLRRPKGA
jgi:hypothetical protein